jgi:HEAT repeat protein
LRGTAVMRLVGLGGITPPDMPHLIAVLDKTDNPTHRGRASEALAGLGEPALPALVERFDDPNRQVRILAIFAAGRMGGAARSALPQLRKLLDDPDRDVRLAAEISVQRIQEGL